MSIRTCVRCAAITSRGTQCTRNTCKYGVHCWQHSRAKGLKLDNSNIDGAGLGLFAAKDFKKNSNVIDYTGEKRTMAELKAEPSNYALEINKNLVIDARKTGSSSLGGRANDCRKANKDQKECKGNNTKFVIDKVRKKARIKAVKKIKKGDEVFVGYGQSYWRGGKNKKKK
tara:strand:- start:30 stop:542 length:513 start_codon:yes stop_codon:yes gene_type:complete